MADTPKLTQGPTPAEQARRVRNRDGDERKRAARQSLSTEGSRAKIKQGKPTSPSYGGPLLLQVLAERDPEE